MLCLFILEFSSWFIKVSVFLSRYMDHTGGLRDYFERNNCNKVYIKDVLYEVRCLKSNEDMILALTGQFKQLSHEPEKFR